MDNSNKSHTILESPSTQNRSDSASGQVGEHLNRFLLCTLVSRTARQIRDAAERNGERLSLLTVTREVLRSALRGESLEREPPVTPASGLDPFDEDALIDEIGRQLQERISPGRADGSEALRPDLASVIAAEEAKPEQPGFAQPASSAGTQQAISWFDGYKVAGWSLTINNVG
jgi:hypothetical protein